jgi:hypothetical protein
MGSLTNVRKPPHEKTFGLEIECAPNNTNNKYTGQYQGFWYFTEDGSLSEREYEYISQPMPYSMAIRQIKKLWKDVGGWRTSNRCGLHIHVSRKHWNESKQEKFMDFLRTLTETQQMTTLFGRYSLYASPFSRGKYRAVNVQHAHTYEFRLWKAGDLEWTLEALRRTRAIVCFNGEWTYETCLKLFNISDTSVVAERPVAAPAVRRIRRPNATLYG